MGSEPKFEIEEKYDVLNPIQGIVKTRSQRNIHITYTNNVDEYTNNSLSLFYYERKYLFQKNNICLSFFFLNFFIQTSFTFLITF